MAFELSSDAFDDGGTIPGKHTCDGEDRSPALRWRGAPAGARSLALICDDPDAPAGIWSHWLLYGIPVDHEALEEGVPADAELPWGACQGRNDFGRLGYGGTRMARHAASAAEFPSRRNDFGRLGYGGPCPPRGHGVHRYSFRLYALDADPELPAGLDRRRLLERIEGHVLDRAELVGTYARAG